MGGAGDLRKLTDPAGRTTSYTYNADGQVLSLAYSDGKTPGVSYSCDSDRRRTEMQDGTGNTVDSWDPRGLLTSAGAQVWYQ